MRIGIVNTGNIGGRLARAWVKAGHDVVLAKDGDISKLAPLLDELGPKARTGTIREASEFGEAVLFSVYWPRVGEVAAQIGSALDGKIVIETMNPLGVTPDFEHFHDLDFMKDSSTSEHLQKLMPNARVVKAFSQLPAPVLEAAAWENAHVGPSVLYCGDDSRAKQAARGLIEDAGFVPVDAGGLSSARQLEQMGVLLHKVAHNEFGGDADLVRLGFALVEANPGPVLRPRES